MNLFDFTHRSLMRSKYLFYLPILFLGILFSVKMQAQTDAKIGNNPGAKNASAVLELESTTKGFLMPRMTTVQLTSISAPATGLTIFNTTDSCVYIYRGTVGGWQSTCSAAYNGGWSLLGNTGTSATTNFIGTTDAVDFVTRTGNTERMRVSSTGNVGIGITTPIYKLDLSGASNILRIQGLTGGLGTVTDSIITIASATGVINRRSIADVLNSTNTAWLLGGNSLLSAGSIGTTTSQDVNVITNGTTRLTVSAAGAITQTGTGVVTLTGNVAASSGATITGTSGVNLNTTGTGTTTIGSATSATAVTGATGINTAGTGATTIGNATSTTAVTGTANINIAGVGTTTIGNATSTTAVTGTANINTAGTGTTTIGNATSATAITGATTINSTGTAANTVGNSTSTTTTVAGATVNLNTTGTVTTNIGSATATTTELGTVNVNNSGTGTMNIGTSAGAAITNIGSATATTNINGTALNITGLASGATTDSLVSVNPATGATHRLSISNVIGSSITANNGLTKTGTNVALGGTLTASTTILQATNDFIVTGGNVGIGAATSPTSTFQVTGSVGVSYKKVTVNTTITGSDYVVLANATSGALTLTLPSATGLTGRMYVVGKTDETTNVVTFSPTLTLTETTTIPSISFAKKYRIVSDGTNWVIVNE
jgi:hypothetical protein